MLFTIVTIFPEMFPGPLSHSLLGKGLGVLWNLKTVNIRDFANNKHHKVDDTPYGGGAGMVMMPDVVHAALSEALSFYEKPPRIIFMTPRGKLFTNKIAKSLVDSETEGVIILCGRYEGIDQRVINYWKLHHGLEEISIGDYVLFGGEIPAMVVLDSCIRFIPGIMGNSESTEDESFSNGLLEYSQYTKPAVWNDTPVPQVLLSGNHAEIAKWRKSDSVEVTKANRPDLLTKQ